MNWSSKTKKRSDMKKLLNRIITLFTGPDLVQIHRDAEDQFIQRVKTYQETRIQYLKDLLGVVTKYSDKINEVVDRSPTVDK